MRAEPSLSFEECLLECGANAEFVTHFDRLAGTNLSGRGSPIELAVDRATGKEADDVKRFADFVLHYIWLLVITTQPL